MLFKLIKLLSLFIIICSFAFITSCSNVTTTAPGVNQTTQSTTSNSGLENLQTDVSQSVENTSSTTPEKKISSNKKIRVPILMYHSVTDNTFGYTDLHVSPSEFEKQVKYLSENGFTPIHFTELNNANNYENPIILTFDDGYKNNYTNAYPILKKYNIKATVFMTSSAIGKKNKLSEDNIKEMLDIVEFQSHSVSHPDLRTISASALDKELKSSQETLEAITGKPVNTIAYPAGKSNDNVIAATKKYYEFGIMARPDGIYTGKNAYAVERLCVSRKTSISSYIKLINYKIK
jgi:peptidoglycan/xylan/chitin deacetylase (PgdA/CDA1 family)